jgi:hypothetical protein
MSERRAKFHTAPGRLRTYGTKRDVPTVWDLFDNPRDPRADSPSTVDDESPQESNPPLLSSSWSSEGSELVVERGGSWPRIRKQRTGANHSMSLFDVAEALEQQHLYMKHSAPAALHLQPMAATFADDSAMDEEMSQLAALVAAERDAQDADASLSGVSGESFVDAVFSDILLPAPAAAPAAIGAPAAPAAPAASTAPATLAAPSKAPPKPAAAFAMRRKPTANELALLEAIAADEAAAAAEVEAHEATRRAEAAKAKAKAAQPSAFQQQSMYPPLRPAHLMSAAAAPPAKNPHRPHTGTNPYGPHAGATSEALYAMPAFEWVCHGMDEDAGVALPAAAPTQSGAALGAPPVHLAGAFTHPTPAMLHRRPGLTIGQPLNGRPDEDEPDEANLDLAFDLPLDLPLDLALGVPHGAHDGYGPHNPRHDGYGPHNPRNKYDASYDALPIAHSCSYLPGQVLAPTTAPYASLQLPPAATAPPSTAPSALPSFGATPQGSLLNRQLALGLKPARNGAERKEWSDLEDCIIQRAVQEHGCCWRKIAVELPGRSDDAVRNRWFRLQQAASTRDAAPRDTPAGCREKVGSLDLP